MEDPKKVTQLWTNKKCFEIIFHIGPFLNKVVWPISQFKRLEKNLPVHLYSQAPLLRSNAAALIYFIGKLTQFFNMKIELFPFGNISKLKYMSAAAMATFTGNIILIFSMAWETIRKIFWPILFFFPEIDNLLKICHKHVPENKIRLQNQGIYWSD